MPFVKGQSGNPGGRPKDDLGVVELCRKLSPKIIVRLARIIEESEDENAITRAASIILDRAWGKPAQSMELTGAEGGPLVVEWKAPDA